MKGADARAGRLCQLATTFFEALTNQLALKNQADLIVGHMAYILT